MYGKHPLKDLVALFLYPPIHMLYVNILYGHRVDEETEHFQKVWT